MLILISTAQPRSNGVGTSCPHQATPTTTRRLPWRRCRWSESIPRPRALIITHPSSTWREGKGGHYGEHLIDDENDDMTYHVDGRSTAKGGLLWRILDASKDFSARWCYEGHQHMLVISPDPNSRVWHRRSGVVHGSGDPSPSLLSLAISWLSTTMEPSMGEMDKKGAQKLGSYRPHRGWSSRGWRLSFPMRSTFATTSCGVEFVR